ncbi:hypothetical protein NHX12_021429 [Muraenolepis orangiensis]|uniref:Uncharacterized protein n=1 Tax=Muraenolepis orangiensis TaxID=630683 RepID=A0A9Q0EQ72_9TELE|nr:hypothetical protein NHX12_021429 [Muraenolepis orangiensis]
MNRPKAKDFKQNPPTTWTCLSGEAGGRRGIPLRPPASPSERASQITAEVSFRRDQLTANNLIDLNPASHPRSSSWLVPPHPRRGPLTL